MEIKMMTEGLTAKDLYQLTKGNDVRGMADAKGETLDICKYVLYGDVQNDDGNETLVLAVETTEGARYATNSKPFIRNFTDILAIYGAGNEEAPHLFKIGSGRSKANREYLTCDIA